MDRLRDLARRFADFWGTFFDAFVRENKVLPPVLALFAILLFAWVVAGVFVDESNDTTSGEADLVQSREPSGDTPIAPEAENRDTDSYAAYRNKDPFRRLFAPAESSSEDTSQENTTDQTDTGESTTGESTTPNENTTGNGGGGDAGGGGSGGGNGSPQTSRNDSDGDGLSNRLEERLGQDPRNPDTDGDGIQDGADDSNNDGVPDGKRGNNAGGGNGNGSGGGAGTGGGGSGNGGGGGGGGNGSDDELFDSGGTLRPR